MKTQTNKHHTTRGSNVPQKGIDAMDILTPTNVRLHTKPYSVYYVSVKDAGRSGLLAGPFDTHQEALDMITATKQEAEKADPFSCFYAFGTAKLTTTGVPRIGILNSRLGITL